jgi:hypothetical protein
MTDITIHRATARDIIDWLADDAITDADVTEAATHGVVKFAEALMNALDEAQGRASEPGETAEVTITIQGSAI